VVVGIEESDQLAAGLAHASVPCRRCPAILLPEDPQMSLGGHVLASAIDDDVDRLIPGPVVNDDELIVGEGLAID
jgi:hypothetical protein